MNRFEDDLDEILARPLPFDGIVTLLQWGCAVWFVLMMMAGLGWAILKALKVI